MKIQFAIDCLSFGRGIQLATAVEPYIDIIELGEEFIARYGHTAIREFKDLFPNKKILADLKIMDSGYKVGNPCLPRAGQRMLCRPGCSPGLRALC